MTSNLAIILKKNNLIDPSVICGQLIIIIVTLDELSTLKVKVSMVWLICQFVLIYEIIKYETKLTSWKPRPRWTAQQPEYVEKVE